MAKILIVDDDLSTVFILKKLLEKEGYATAWTSSGKGALESIQAEKPDIVLLDVMMPDMNGWEVCKRIKSNEATSKIPVAMLTVRGELKDRAKSFQYAHADAHINKPLVNEELFSTVKLLLERASKEAEPKGKVEGKEVPKIMLVDDDIITSFTVKKLLGKEDYDIREVPSGREALELLETEHPDLILLDVMMPDMDGWEVCKRIKSNEATSKIPVAMLTVRGEWEDKAKSFQYAHADAHINKPIINEELLNMVKLLISSTSKED